jgi:hypothetical protein
MMRLQSVPTRNGGLVTEWGDYSSLRDCTQAARQIHKLSGREMYFSARSDEPDSFDSHMIALTPGEYQQDTELVLSDGQIVWLGDVDEVLRKHASRKR